MTSDASSAGEVALATAVVEWFVHSSRDLPWRSADRTPWGVLVSEVMLQQTPVDRVIPVWAAWIVRWPTPTRLADDEPAQAVRQWGRLGYPRRALNLHRAAVAIVERHAGVVPDDEGDLRSLPGVGEYTAAAVRSFAFGRRAVVLDTNVRRVLARSIGGQPLPPRSLTVAERGRADGALPAGDAAAVRTSAALMELGALVCTAARPRCDACPLAGGCAWVAAGRPAPEAPPRRAQRYEGTDRQARGRLMAVLREADGPVDRAALDAAWPDAEQRDRALRGLVVDGLAEPGEAGSFALPSRRGGR